MSPLALEPTILYEFGNPEAITSATSIVVSTNSDPSTLAKKVSVVVGLGIVVVV